MNKTAIISDDKNYRYSLSRIWDETKPKVMFLMLNPSTADAEQDDPTVRRCINFAKAWGYGGLYIGNLFAYRATKPKDILKIEDPVGELNNYYLHKISKACEAVVCAWGNPSIIRKMTKLNKVISLENISLPFNYIALTKNGTPKHPLYLKKTLKPKPYER